MIVVKGCLNIFFFIVCFSVFWNRVLLVLWVIISVCIKLKVVVLIFLN